jgi:hypothetical protein
MEKRGFVGNSCFSSQGSIDGAARKNVSSFLSDERFSSAQLLSPARDANVTFLQFPFP